MKYRIKAYEILAGAMFSIGMGLVISIVFYSSLFGSRTGIMLTNSLSLVVMGLIQFDFCQLQRRVYKQIGKYH